MSNKSDQIGLFDPLLSAIGPRGSHKYFQGGYKVWPDSERVAQANVRIMAIGNSTSLWPDAAWSLHLGQSLADKGVKVAIYNGAGKGNTSSQEVLRVLRDTPAIKPNIIVSLSGICDIGYLLNAKNYPFSHKYSRRVMSHAKEEGVISGVNYGFPDDRSPAQIWCYNQRMKKILAEEQGARAITILQPVQGFGSYPQSADEKLHFSQKAPVILKAADKPYSECVKEFYTEVLDMIRKNPELYGDFIDFTDVFADCPGAYRDHRHQSQVGVEYLAKEIESIVMAQIKSLGLAK